MKTEIFAVLLRDKNNSLFSLERTRDRMREQTYQYISIYYVYVLHAVYNKIKIRTKKQLYRNIKHHQTTCRTQEP